MITRIAWAVVLAVLVGCCALMARAAFAQDEGDLPVEPDAETLLVIAQSMVAEGDWANVDDHAAIAHALQRTADLRHVSLLQHALDYVAAFDPRNHRERAVWIRGLNLAGVEPEGWPQTVSWSSRRVDWFGVIERARAFLRGDLPDPCPGSHDWGGGMDDPPAGLVKVMCIRHTANTVYRRASR